MSYIVEYNPELRKNYPMQYKKTHKFPLMVLVFTLSVFILLYVLNTTGALRLLTPGDPVVTAGAFADMVEQVRDGQSVSEAIFLFFKDVISGGMK